MKRKRKGLVVLAIVAMVAILGVGYAAITGVGFTINGNASAEGNQSAFNVHFSAVNYNGDEVSTTTAKHTENQNGAQSGTFSITGLTTKGERAVFTYEIKNESSDLTATIPIDAIKVSGLKNEDYFAVNAYNPVGDGGNIVINPGETGQIAVEVELLKTPISAVATGDVTITFTANPTESTTTNG